MLRHCFHFCIKFKKISQTTQSLFQKLWKLKSSIIFDCDFQISMSVLLTHVKMVLFALMASMDTHVYVHLDSVGSTVKSVSILGVG